jgi:hypothetical protein
MRYVHILTLATLVAVSTTFGAELGVAQMAQHVSSTRVAVSSTVTEIPATSVAGAADTPDKPAAFARAYGVVTDSAGHPVADAQLELANGSPFGTVYLRTDAAGRFVTDSLRVGETYSVAVARLGYRAIQLKPFTARADSVVAFHVVLPHRTVTVVKAAEPVIGPVVRLAHEQ